MSPRIIIIGAGAAGIAAGTKLWELGFKNLLLLEAENRIGGRINTIPFASNVIDLGAQWCHGEEGNVVYNLASPYKLFESATTKYDKFKFIFSDKQELDQGIGDRLMELAIETVECYKDDICKYRGSLGSFIVKKYQQILRRDENKDIDPQIAMQFLEFFHKYENSIEASDTWYDTSAQGFLHYWDCDGDRLLNWKDKGYKTVLNIMMRKFPDPSKDLQLEKLIHFNKTVTGIEWNREPTHGSVLVSCSDGSSHLADHVIVTVSLGVLKAQYLSLFNPALPQLKKNAIQGLTLGTVDKLFLEFKEPFWTKDWQGFSLLWNQSDLHEIRQREDSWIQDIFGFYTVDYQPNTLCGWISGVNARRMELTPKDEALKSIMFVLRKFLKNVPDPIRFERSTWFTNPHFRGSYSYRSIATDLLNTSAADLASPLPGKSGEPSVCFAGEATSDHYYSTVHGAIESGWREAKRITDFYYGRKAHL